MFNTILCLVQSLLDTVFSVLNSVLGLIGVELSAPDIGCQE